MRIGDMGKGVPTGVVRSAGAPAEFPHVHARIGEETALDDNNIRHMTHHMYIASAFSLRRLRRALRAYSPVFTNARCMAC